MSDEGGVDERPELERRNTMSLTLLEAVKEKSQALICEFVGSAVFGTIFMVTLFNEGNKPTHGDASQMGSDQTTELTIASGSVALGIGAAYMCMVFIGMNVSGGHYNPAVTFGYVVSQLSFSNGIAKCFKDCAQSGVMLLIYSTSQMGGYLVAAIVARLIVGKNDFKPIIDEHCHDPGSSGERGAGDCSRVVFAEICTTFLLITVFICAVAKQGSSFVCNFSKPELGAAALTVGFAMMSGVSMASSISGAVLNPALTVGNWFGQNVLNAKKDVDDVEFAVVLYFIMAQYVGALLAGLLAISGITHSQ